MTLILAWIESLHQTRHETWAYKRLYTSEKARRAALPGWLHTYNYHRPHGALGGQTPYERLRQKTQDPLS